MRGSPGAWPRDHLMLDWKSTLSQQSQCDVSPIIAEFSLQTLSRVGPNLDFSGDQLSQTEAQSQSRTRAKSELLNHRFSDREASLQEQMQRAKLKSPSSKGCRSSNDAVKWPTKSFQNLAPQRPAAASDSVLRSRAHSSFTSTSQYASEPLEAPRVSVTSPEVLAERAARAAAEGKHASRRRDSQPFRDVMTS